MTDRHKVFVSYYHDEDQKYRETFENLFAERFDIMVSKSVDKGDINPNLSDQRIYQKIRDEYISDATVTVVLIGRHTWQRKHVDWEIYSSLRNTEKNPRCGLLGIFLPSYPLTNNKYNPHTIPPRLHDNIKSKYAKAYGWSKEPDRVGRWIDQAFKRRREKQTPNLKRPMFKGDLRGDSWEFSSPDSGLYI